MNKLFYVLVVFLFLGSAFKVNAQRRPPNPPGLEDKVPIDMGLTLLLVVGAGLGIKKLRSKNKE